MNREDKKAYWLIIWVGDLAAKSIVREEVWKLVGYSVEAEAEEITFVWIGLFKTIKLHYALKKYGIISMFDRVHLKNSIWS